MKKCLSNFDLKLIAIITMTIDHIGVVFGTPFYNLLRAVGRLSFPIFAFLLTEGYVHTKSFSKYFLRLLVLALISEVIYDYVFFGSFIYIGANNIFFTLALGLLTLFLLDKSKGLIKRYFKDKVDLFIILPITYLLIIVIMGLMGEFLNFSYGMLGILVISFFYLFKTNFPLVVISVSLSTLILGEGMQYFSLFSLILIYFYNQKLGKKSKLFFYLYYPLHILVLGFMIMLKKMI